MNTAVESATLLERYRAVRDLSTRLIAPLSAEDACVQSMPDASPAKWHLAHTTWFFETVVLETLNPGYASPFEGYRVLFNSYYQGVGPQFARPQRGLITRPDLTAIRGYRTAIDDVMQAALAGRLAPAVAALVELGLHHEQQHQELLLMDVKHLFACNPLGPTYRSRSPLPKGASSPLRWISHAGGLVDAGTSAPGFAFDNERPRHQQFLRPFALGNRPVTNSEFRDFIADGAYRSPLLWLADGWATVQRDQWAHPAYWRDSEGHTEFTLAGWQAIDPAAPVSHVSFYEAEAYARWANARLPTEFEWEHAASVLPPQGKLLDEEVLAPRAAPGGDGLQQMFGEVWEWTASPYAPYPGFRPAPGVVAEYNGKFMANQMVLRGGCCVTPPNHIRATYRNFFYPHQRWQFSGLRLARDA